MVKPMHEQSPAVKLLTILNVQSAKPPSVPKTSSSSPSSSSRPTRPDKTVKTRDWHSIANKDDDDQHKKKRLKPSSSSSSSSSSEQLEKQDDDQDDDEPTTGEGEEEDSFKAHFGPSSKLVESSEDDPTRWNKSRTHVAGIGHCHVLSPSSDPVENRGSLNLYSQKMLDKLKRDADQIPRTHHDWLNLLSSYRDVSYSKLQLGQPLDDVRESISLHAMNHVLKTRSRILKNNEHLSKLAAQQKATRSSTSSTLLDDDKVTTITTDQGFTRPKVLILAPFRSSALAWVQHLVNFTLASQIENYERFLSEYSLPEGVEDKLVTREDEYPRDHVETFKGNIDDSFRCGVKVNRKQVKLFSEFYQADAIVASPLGLRTSIEKEDDSDFLSSIEIVIVDQMDVMLMQNWDHVNFVMEKLNKMPEEDHGCDFSRVKPWYLDGKAKFLRQSILLSRYQTPETLSLFTNDLVNRAGKLRTIDSSSSDGGVLDQVPRGLKQVWNRFECESSSNLDDKRFEHFTQRTLPSLMKSAISSQQTIVFIPDYFDFVRVKRYLTKKLDDFSFASISEYTPTPDVSRARGAFFSGKKKFLLVTERFHFFRRYRLRGAKTVVFYAPPSHPSYYPEFLSFPFTSPSSSSSRRGLEEEDDKEVDESELSAHVVFSKFDLLKLERIVGTKDARRMCDVGGGSGGGGGGKSESRFTFV
ncbi:hypothetical protein JCM3766R1_004069 [Sporobolomyces carnicolor]